MKEVLHKKLKCGLTITIADGLKLSAEFCGHNPVINSWKMAFGNLQNKLI
jgi:hypothetical protein